MSLLRCFTLTALLLAQPGCGSPGPRPLAWGTDACAHCHMPLADSRVGGELVTRQGRSYPFDDIGCLARFVAEGQVPAERIHSLWVVDHLRPGELIPARAAVFLRRPDLATPMASGLAAFATRAAADSVRLTAGGTILTWEEVLAGRAGGDARPYPRALLDSHGLPDHRTGPA